MQTLIKLEDRRLIKKSVITSDGINKFISTNHRNHPRLNLLSEE